MQLIPVESGKSQHSGDEHANNALAGMISSMGSASFGREGLVQLNHWMPLCWWSIYTVFEKNRRACMVMAVMTFQMERWIHGRFTRTRCTDMTKHFTPPAITRRVVERRWCTGWRRKFQPRIVRRYTKNTICGSGFQLWRERPMMVCLRSICTEKMLSRPSLTRQLTALDMSRLCSWPVCSAMLC